MGAGPSTLSSTPAAKTKPSHPSMCFASVIPLWFDELSKNNIQHINERMLRERYSLRIIKQCMKKIQENLWNIFMEYIISLEIRRMNTL